ncbi:uncharacterized protein LOC128548534 isoform X2 [Mercenaria mercenaria]|uniref:uncharacterized protein LOC128548534 isoform X2 n=1 Tax=Mercenaria mercenaria TaxID=6596 RepID=UPI00234F82AA|nr:uncharacterized protein LOC128548534 isoform X2 [Mercenaria mercenaria]
MGISEDNIQTVVPDKKQSLSQKMMQAIECLSSRDLQTLIIYITCHGENRNDTKDNFNFRLSETDTVTLKEFEDALGQCKEKLDQLNKVMLFFDCCHPPEEVNIKGIAKANVIQLNACEDYQKAHSTNEGSIFTKFLIQGLKAKAEGSTCGENECTSCKKYWDLRTDYVTVERLLEYINDHIDTRQRPRLLFSGNHDDFKIAFYTGEEVVIEFTVVNSEEKQTIKLKHFKDMEQIETQLYEKFHRNKDDFDIVITSRTFRTDNTTEICSSAEKVVLAWVNRQPIQVSFKPKCKANSTADTGTSTTSTMVLYERRNAAEGKCSIPESGTP